MVCARPAPLGGSFCAYSGSGISRTLLSSSRIAEYFGARDVRTPWTTAETQSAPNRAFHAGTKPKWSRRLWGSIKKWTYNSE
jgi:hypothetical protein